jgi:hypothetical protein
MANPFKPDDKVRIKVKGADVEATVRLVWNDEVQVRIPDKTLLWRAVKTVHPLDEPAPASSEPPQTPPPPAEPTAIQEASIQPAHPSPTADMAAPAQVEVHSAGVENAQPEPPAPTPIRDTQLHGSDTSAMEVSSCGVPETVADRKRARRNGRRK